MNFLKKHYLLISIVVFGLCLRIWGISFGLYHPDEPLVVNQALAFGSGNFIPFIYYYPPLFHYILFIFYGLFFVIGWIIGPFRDFNNFLNLVLINQEYFYIIGRALTAIFGTATIIPVYLIAKKLYSESAANISALFIACVFLHVKNSHYCTVDVPMTFMVILTYIFIMRIVYYNKLKDYILGGLFAGLAIATKYNAGVLIFCIGAAGLSNISFKYQANCNMQVVRNLILSGICAIIVCLCFCSYLITDFSGSKAAFEVLRSLGESMNISTWYRFRVDLFYGIGLPIEMLGIFGLLYLIFRKKKDGIVFAMFPILYLLCIKKVGQPFARYSIPILPFFAISSGVFISFAVSKLRVTAIQKKVTLFIIVFIAILVPLAKSIYADYLFSRPDIQDLARDWICENIPSGSSIVIDNSQQAPHLYPTKEQIADKIKLVKSGSCGADIKKKRLELLAESVKYQKYNYQLYYFGIQPSEFLMHTPVIPYEKSSLNENSIEYIITNIMSEKSRPQFYKSIKDRLVLMEEFSPLRDKNSGYSKYQYSYMPIDNAIYNLRNNGIGIKIYKVKK